MQLTLLDLQNVLRSIGRGVVFYAPYWDGSSEISLTHLGDTEGDIAITPAQEFSSLTTPELTGGDEHETYVQGSNITATIPLYVADPALRAIISPTGSASGGTSRRQPVAKYTLMIVPEELMFDEAGSRLYEDLEFTAGVWTVGGTPLTARQTALLGQMVSIWRGYWMTPPIVFKHGDGGKAVETVTFRGMHDSSKPENNKVYTIGDPADAGIDLEGGS